MTSHRTDASVRMHRSPVRAVLCRLASGLAAAAMFLAPAPAAQAQSSDAPRAASAKPRLAIGSISATQSVLDQARTQGQEPTLLQILEAADGQLANAIEETRKFEVVARSQLDQVIREQRLGESGLVADDPQRARMMGLEGAGFVLTAVVDNFEDLTTRAVLEGQLGASQLERRTIQLQAVVRIYSSTSGSLVRSSAHAIETDAMVTEVVAGQQQDGRKSNKLVGEIARKLAVLAAADLTDFLFPPKVTAMTNGIISFNRTKQSGVQPGEWWQVLAPGEEMTDPDTGESLGAEEVPVGWAQVLDAGDRTSRAQVFDDRGVDCGAIMRRVPSPPPGADGLLRGGGSCAPRRSAVGNLQGQPVPPVLDTAAAPSDAAGRTTTAPLRVAIFVQSRVPSVDGALLGVLEDSVRASLSSPGIEIVSREDAVNRVSALAAGGENSGLPGGADLDRLLSDRTSATNLAASMQAQALIVGSVMSLTEQTITTQDERLGGEMKVSRQTMSVAYRIVDAATGGTLSSSTVVKSESRVADAGQSQGATPVADLLRSAGDELGALALRSVTSGSMRDPSSAPAEITVQLNPVVADFSIPEIEVVDGKATVGAGRYRLEPTQMTVSIDGLLLGSIPGKIAMAPGIHTIRIEHPSFEPYTATLKARDGMEITVPMRVAADSIVRWKELTAFLQGLKEQAVLTEAELENAKAFATLLRNSSIRIDTTNLRSISVERSLWREFLR